MGPDLLEDDERYVSASSASLDRRVRNSLFLHKDCWDTDTSGLREGNLKAWERIFAVSSVLAAPRSGRGLAKRKILSPAARTSFHILEELTSEDETAYYEEIHETDEKRPVLGNRSMSLQKKLAAMKKRRVERGALQ